MKKTLLGILVGALFILLFLVRAQAYHENVHEQMTIYAKNLYFEYHNEPWYSDEIIFYHYDIQQGAKHEDAHDHVWRHWGSNGECVTITHFWDPDSDDPYMHTVACNGENAYWKARILWGMALGQYYIGNKDCAYEYLGHIAHLLGDMSVPAHAHYDSHVNDDTYEAEYMNGLGLEVAPIYLTYEESCALRQAGLIEIPPGQSPLFYLFYTTAQRAGRYASESYDGNANDPLGLVNFAELECPDGCDFDYGVEDCDYTVEGLCRTCMEVIRRNSYFYGIRAIATLYRLFEEYSKRQGELTVVIHELKNTDSSGSDLPEFFVRVKIGDTWFRNEGEQTTDTCDGCITDLPLIHGCKGWAFARDVGLSGLVRVEIELWDEDSTDYQQWDIYSGPNEPEDGEERAIWLDVDIQKCREGASDAISYDLTGPCRVKLWSVGDDDPDADIWFSILPPNTAPKANAGPDQTVNEGDHVTLSGSLTDPDTNDTHTFLWHLESSSGANCMDVPDANTQTLSFIPCDDCVYTFSFTVTDNHGVWDTDTVVVTVRNVPPIVNDVHISGQPNSEFILPAVHKIEFQGTFTDDGTCDTHTAVWDWGDSTTSGAGIVESNGFGTASSSHIYLLPGDYTVTLCVTDDDGNAGCDTTTVHVAGVDEALDIFNTYIQSLPNGNFKNNANQRKAALNNMFGSLDRMLAAKNYGGMISLLNSNMRTKFDGLVGGSPKDDWIKEDIAIQTELCQKVDDITAYLKYLLSLSP